MRRKPSDDVLAEVIAEQVTAMRAARGLSQSELAVLCGTTQSAIARLERGARPPRIDTLARVAEALDCSLTVRLDPRTDPGGTAGTHCEGCGRTVLAGCTTSAQPRRVGARFCGACGAG